MKTNNHKISSKRVDKFKDWQDLTKNLVHNVIMIILIVLLLAISSCKFNHDNSQLKDSKIIVSDWNIRNKYLIESNCQFGNTIIEITKNGNYLKYTYINDSQYNFSCGKENIEVCLLKKMDAKSKTPIRIHDNEHLIYLCVTGGTDTWYNYFVNVNNGHVSEGQAVYIDTINNRFIDMEYKNGEVYFILHLIEGKSVDSIKSNYSNYRKDRNYYMHITDVSLIELKKLTYNINLPNGTIKSDTLNLYK